MTVSADKTAIETDISCLICGNHFKLRTHEIALCDAVFIIENFHDIELYRVACLYAVGARTDENIELFTRDDITACLCHLTACEMREQVCDIENRVIIVFADNNLDHASVLLGNNAVNGKRYGCPLIFLDAAVVMRLEEAEAVRFIERMLLQVYSR